MALVAINVKDTYQKGAVKKIYININQITVVEQSKFGWRVGIAIPGSATPPKAGEQYPKSFFEPFSFQVSEAQAQTLLAHINTLAEIKDLCVDDAGSASVAAAPAPAITSAIAGF